MYALLNRHGVFDVVAEKMQYFFAGVGLEFDFIVFIITQKYGVYTAIYFLGAYHLAAVIYSNAHTVGIVHSAGYGNVLCCRG